MYTYTSPPNIPEELKLSEDQIILLKAMRAQHIFQHEIKCPLCLCSSFSITHITFLCTNPSISPGRNALITQAIMPNDFLNGLLTTGNVHKLTATCLLLNQDYNDLESSIILQFLNFVRVHNPFKLF